MKERVCGFEGVLPAADAECALEVRLRVDAVVAAQVAGLRRNAEVDGVEPTRSLTRVSRVGRRSHGASY
jgi:hypothetical protein